MGRMNGRGEGGGGWGSLAVEKEELGVSLRALGALI